MALTKILINNSGSELQILNRQVANGGQYDVPYSQYNKLADSIEIANKVSSLDIIVNNGTSNLGVSEALEYLKTLELPSVEFSYEKIDSFINLPINQQMVVHKEILMEINGELKMDGNVVLIE